MKLHNYTPHNIVIRNGEKDLILTSEGSARVSQTPGTLQQETVVNEVAIPIYGPSQYGQVDGLPEPQDGHYYIVSFMVANALPTRKDLLTPGSGPADGAIRENGQIVAVTRLISQGS